MYNWLTPAAQEKGKEGRPKYARVFTIHKTEEWHVSGFGNSATIINAHYRNCCVVVLRSLKQFRMATAESHPILLNIRGRSMNIYFLYELCPAHNLIDYGYTPLSFFSPGISISQFLSELKWQSLAVQMSGYWEHAPFGQIKHWLTLLTVHSWDRWGN